MKDPKCEFGAHARTRKYKIVFAKVHTLNWSEEVFVIKKILKKILCRGQILLAISRKALLDHFTKKNIKRQIRQGLKLKK